MFYDRVYLYLLYFASYQIHGYPLCRLLAPFVFLVIVWVSRLNSSIALKAFAVIAALLFYFLPDILKVFLT